VIRPLAIVALFVAVCVLASTATASAECAWVLWREFLNDQPQIVGAWNQRVDCERRRPGEYPAKQDVPDSGRFLKVGIDKDGKEVFMRAFCLPDTVDPRGPKGK
jgi:hypothetical protein